MTAYDVNNNGVLDAADVKPMIEAFSGDSSQATSEQYNMRQLLEEHGIVRVCQQFVNASILMENSKNEAFSEAQRDAIFIQGAKDKLLALDAYNYLEANLEALLAHARDGKLPQPSEENAEAFAVLKEIAQAFPNGVDFSNLSLKELSTAYVSVPSNVTMPGTAKGNEIPI